MKGEEKKNGKEDKMVQDQKQRKRSDKGALMWIQAKIKNYFNGHWKTFSILQFSSFLSD